MARTPTGTAQGSKALQELAELRRRVTRGIRLHLASRAIVIWALATATVVVIARTALGASALPLVLASLVGLLVGLLVAILVADRRSPHPDRLAAFIDDRMELGGLLVASAETAIGPWQQRLPPLGATTVRWRMGRWWPVLGCSALYLLAALIVPIGAGRGIAAAGDLDVSSEVEELSAAIETLEVVEALEPAAADTLQEALDRASAEASAADPAEAYETLDRTAREVKQVAAEALEHLLATEQRLRQVEALTEALRGDAGAASQAQLEELGQTLAELARQLELADQGELARQLHEAAGAGSLPSELLSELSRRLDGRRADLVRKLVRLEHAKLVDVRLVERCERCRRGGKEGGGGLMAFLADHDGEAASDLIAVWCDQPSRGGISRGRGDAAMTWSNGSEPSGVAFKEQVLPAAGLAAPGEADLVGITATAPQAGAEVVEGRSGVLAGGGDGGSAVQRQLLPRHRRVVERYFARGPRPQRHDGPGAGLEER